METIELKKAKSKPEQSNLSISRRMQFKREWWWRVPLHIILIIGAGLMLLPFVWMFFTSFKPPPEVIAWPPTFVPASPTLDNYGKVFELMPFARYFLNSVFVTIVCMVTICITSSLAGYIFGIFKFPLRNVIFFIILATAIVP